MVTRATYQTIVRWGVGPIGNVTAFDAIYGVAPYATAYDDISTLVALWTSRRGRSDPAGAIGAATYTWTLRDPQGWFVPGNAASPLIGAALDGLGNLLPYRTIRLQAYNPVAPVTKAYGYITRITPDPAAKTATIEASDALHRLAQPLKQAYTLTGLTLRVAVNYLLTTRFGGDYSYAYSAEGNALPATIAVAAGEVPLTIIGNLLAADRGLFYARADGTMQYLDRHWHDWPPRNAAQSTLTNVQVRRLATGVDVATVVNSATVTGLGDLIAAPASAPTLTTPTGGNLPAGNFTVAYSYTNGGGETAKSPTATTAAAAADVVHVAAVTPLPSGATGVNWYMSVAPGSSSLRLVRSGTGAAEDFENVPAADAALPLATGTARNPVAQTVDDATSQARYDPRPLGAITTPYLPTNADALNTATWLVKNRKDVASLAYAADLDGDAGANVLDAILSRDLHDRVAIDALGVGSADYFIIGVSEQVDEARQHKATWVLQRRRGQDIGALVGYSRVGQCAVGYAVV